MSELRDGWSKFDIGVKAFAAVIIPSIIWYAGHLSGEREKASHKLELTHQESMAKEEHDADRATALLGHLTSSNEQERILAIHLAQQLVSHGQLSADLVPGLRAVAEHGETPQEREAANIAIESAASSEIPTLVRQLVGSNRRTASNQLAEQYATSPVAVVTALVNAILPPNDHTSYHMNLYIARTLGAIPGGWRGTDPQVAAVAALRRTPNYRDPTFRDRLDEALLNRVD